MANFSDEVIQQVWNKGAKVDGYDSSKYRKDACGAWMQHDKYGEEHIYGWEIDHVYPTSKGGDDDLVNLRPMHWENNRSKADDYPSYNAAVTSDGNKNVNKVQGFTVNEDLQAALKKEYSR